jgi:DNA-binding beta-propeller fold protein YncE
MGLAGAAAATTRGSIIRSFETPCNGRTDGIDFRAGYIYHANFNGPCELLKTDTSGSVISSLPEPPGAMDVDFTGSAYWVYAYSTRLPYDRIVRLNAGGSVVASYPAPSYGRGIAHAGTYLWYSTAGNHYWNYVYQLTTGASVVSSFQAPHGQGYLNRGLDWDGQYLWLAQAGTGGGRIYRITTSGSVVSSLFLAVYQPTGVAWDGSCVWMADAVSEWIYQMTWTEVAVGPASLGRVKALYR